MKFLKARAWFVRYKGSLALGVTVGILVSNIIILYGQNHLSKQILEVSQQIKQQILTDNNARKQARKESQASDDLIVNLLYCIALINPNDRTPENIQNCVDTARRPGGAASTIKTTPTPSTQSPQSQSNTVPRQNPTTSIPPENPSDSETIGDTIKKVPGKALELLKSVTRSIL